MPYPSTLVGDASVHVSVADYEPEGLDVLMRLYYPTERPPPSEWSLSRPRFMPRFDYLHGLAHFLLDLEKRPWWFRTLARLTCLFAFAATEAHATIPASIDASPHATNGPMPVVVFSHGLAGNRNMYAGLCSAMASRGYLVAAIEHRDGSASCAATLRKTDGGETRVTYRPYLHTDGDFGWRREQIAVRVREMEAAIDALSAAAHAPTSQLSTAGADARDGGKGAPPPPRNVFPGSRFDPATQLRGRVDVSRLVAAGHSFGGATVLSAMSKNPRVRRAVMLDPWTEPFGPCSSPAHPLVRAAASGVPTAVVNSETWAGADMRPFYREARAPWIEAIVAGTKHQDVSDVPLRAPMTAKTIGMKGTTDSHKTLDLTSHVIDVFLAVLDRAGDGGDAGVARELHDEVLGLTQAFKNDVSVALRSPAAGR